MGGSIDLLETAVRVPPWEPLRLLSQEELRGMRLTNSDDLFEAPVRARCGARPGARNTMGSASPAHTGRGARGHSGFTLLRAAAAVYGPSPHFLPKVSAVAKKDSKKILFSTHFAE